MPQAIRNKLPAFFKRYAIPILIAWTILVVILVLWSFYRVRSEIVERAQIKARTLWEYNDSIRKWIVNVGGIYARKDKMPPNPYLWVPDRDKTTTDGIELTMANSAYVMRQVFEVIKKELEPPLVLYKFASDNYLNPDNKADEWEMKWLKEFEKGD